MTGVASLQTLGGFRFSVDGRELVAPPTQKARALLAYLVWNPSTEFSRERIIELFWPECDPERGRSSLNTALWSIRRSLRDGGTDPAAYLAADKTKISWTADVTLDAKEFQRLAQRPDAQAKRDAIELYRGEFLEGHYDDWSAAQRERSDAAYQALLAESVELHSDVQSAHRLIERGTYDETPYALVAQAEIDAGRTAVAAAVVERARAALAELGTEPSPEFESRFSHLRSTAGRAKRELTLPFFGRDVEIDALRNAFARVAAGQGGIVLVQGAAGSGKSELLRHAAATGTDDAVNIVSITALENDPRAFGAWSGLYEELTGTPFSEFSAAGGGAPALRQALLAAFKPPVVLLVDDAQFLTGDALQILLDVASAIAGQSILLVIATRNEGVRALVAALPRHEGLELSPLSLAHVRDAIEAIAGSDSAPLAAFLHERSGGHAFFLAQLFDSLIATRALRGDRNAVVFDPTMAGAETPVTIRNFIDARLRARGDDPVTVACALALEAGATAEDLTAVCGIGEDRTLDAIDDLLALGLIQQPATGPQFRFDHDLIREAASRALNSGRRVKIHRAFATLFETDQRRESPLQRARHLRASGQSRAALEAFREAALAFIQVSASRDAIEAAASGIEAGKRLNASPDIHMLMYRLYEIKMRGYEEIGDYEALLAQIDAAVPHARESGDPSTIVAGLIARSWSKTLALADPHIGIDDLDEALAVARASKDERILSNVLSRRTYAFEVLGDERRALESAREALEIAERTKDAYYIGHAAVSFLTGLTVWWHFDEAETIAERALAAAREFGIRLELSARITRAGLWYLLDRWEDARVDMDIVGGYIDAPDVEFSMPRGRGESIASMRFRHRTQAALLALARERWDDALAAAGDILENPLVMTFENNRRIGQLIRIEGLLGRDQPRDRQEAYELATELSPPPPNSATGSVILLREVALARAAARVGRGDVSALLSEASRVLDVAIARMPLDGDRAYLALAASAREAGQDELADRFFARGTALRERRIGI